MLTENRLISIVTTNFAVPLNFQQNCGINKIKVKKIYQMSNWTNCKVQIK